MPDITSRIKGCILYVTYGQDVQVKWEIPEFFNQVYEGGHYLKSSFFQFAEAEWSIEIFPRHSGKVYLELLKRESKKDIRISATIGIKKSNDDIFKSFFINHVFLQNGPRWEYSHFPSSELFESKDMIAPNGVLTVFLSAQVLNTDDKHLRMETACQTLKATGSDTLSRNLKEEFLTRNTGEITFNVGDKKFSAHKFILTARSSVFRAMFEVDMVEKEDGTINISDSEPEQFEQFLLYLYSGELDFVSSSNALQLYHLADKYNLEELIEACRDCLIHEISVNSFYDTALLASVHNETEIMDSAVDYFIQNAYVILTTPKWATFILENFAVANEFLIKMANSQKMTMKS